MSGWSALVALGANLPHGGLAPEATLRAASAALGALGAVAGASRAWRSPSWPPGGPDYANGALRLALPGATGPGALLGALHAVEAAFGRTRDARWGPRTLDLDLLSLDGPEGPLVAPDAATWALWSALPPERQGREAPEGPVLPHPRLQDRAFVLLPLREVAPLWRHPVTGRSVAAMIARLPPEARAGVRPAGPPLAPASAPV